LFFVISGFIIIVSSCERRSLLRKKTIGAFMAALFIRIVPMMWLAIASYAVLRLLGRGVFDHTPYVNAFFLLPFGDYDPNHIWTLRQEAIFYVIFALSFLWLRANWLFAVWLAAPFAVAMIMPAQDPETMSAASQILLNIGSSQNMLFGMGAGIGFAYLRFPDLFDGGDGPLLRLFQTWWMLAACFVGILSGAMALDVGTRGVGPVLVTGALFSGMVAFCACRARHMNSIVYYFGNAYF
jgi:exopolysaccharide production protein ExoZ